MDPKSLPGGGPAFPTDSGQQVGHQTYHYEGMAMRDYFAAQAMQGMLANPQQDYAPLTQKAMAAVVFGAYEVADAMLKARDH